jgi:hypothetical protein
MHSSQIPNLFICTRLLLKSYCNPSPPHPTIGIDGWVHRVDRVLSFFSVVGIGTPPTPHPQASVTPPAPLVPGVGAHALAGERGGGRVPIPARGQTLWYSVYICTLWVGILQICQSV